MTDNNNRRGYVRRLFDSFVRGVANAVGMSVGVFAFLALAAWMAGLLR